eukprot:gene48294-5965_t
MSSHNNPSGVSPEERQQLKTLPRIGVVAAVISLAEAVVDSDD